MTDLSEALQQVVSGWCDPRRVKILRDIPAANWAQAVLAAADRGQRKLTDQEAALLRAASSSWATLPPLLTDLQAAVVPSGESRGGGRRGSGGGPDWDAVAILDGLRITVADWADMAGLTRRPDLTHGMRQLAAHQWPDLDVAAMLARVLAHLRRRAEHLLTPGEVAPVRYVRQDCPECGYRELIIDTDGEAVRGYALVVEFHRGFVNSLSCQVCWSYWTRGQLQEWAKGLLTAVPA